MQHKDIKSFLPHIFFTTFVIIVLGALGYLFVQTYTLEKQNTFLTMEIASSTAMLLKNTNQLSQNLVALRGETTGLSNTLSSTQQNVDAVKTQVGGVQQIVGSISSSVGSLEKLARIDPELLKKYSKVYFMNENYVPAHLTAVPSEYVYSATRSEQFLTEGWPFLKNLIDTAKAEGVTLYVKSAYRSFGEQQALKSSYTVTYGAGTANSFSADQGYSEHQMGTTVDFMTSGIDGQLGRFETTDAYRWLVANAHRFGFQLSYPKGNSYYVSEPWHWRFVGVKLATYLHDKKINFYDADQREIDTYLINLFD